MYNLYAGTVAKETIEYIADIINKGGDIDDIKNEIDAYDDELLNEDVWN